VLKNRNQVGLVSTERCGAIPLGPPAGARGGAPGIRAAGPREALPGACAGRPVPYPGLLPLSLRGSCGGGVENLSQFNSDREPKVRAPRKCFYVAVLMGFIMSHKFSTLAYFRGFTKPHRFLASWPKKVIGHLPLCLPGCTTCTTPPPGG